MLKFLQEKRASTESLFHAIMSLTELNHPSLDRFSQFCTSRYKEEGLTPKPYKGYKAITKLVLRVYSGIECLEASVVPAKLHIELCSSA